jgi:ABC-type polysaccharide transport system permease subunit
MSGAPTRRDVLNNNLRHIELPMIVSVILVLLMLRCTYVVQRWRNVIVPYE